MLPGTAVWNRHSLVVLPGSTPGDFSYRWQHPGPSWPEGFSLTLCEFCYVLVIQDKFIVILPASLSHLWEGTVGAGALEGGYQKAISS